MVAGEGVGAPTTKQSMVAVGADGAGVAAVAGSDSERKVRQELWLFPAAEHRTGMRGADLS